MKMGRRIMATVLCMAVAATFAGHIPIMANAEGSSGQTEARQENTDLNTQAAAGLPAALTTLSAVQNGTLGTAPTATPSAAPAGTPSTTPTSTPGATPIGTPSTTPTSTPGATPEGTPSATPAGTPTAMPEGTPTATPAGTPSATPIGTPTATPTATPEALLYNMQNNQNMLGGTRTQFRWDKTKTAAENIENGLGIARHFAVFADGYQQANHLEGNIAVNVYSADCNTHEIGNSVRSLSADWKTTIHVKKTFTQKVTTTVYFQLYCGESPASEIKSISFANTTEGSVDFSIAPSKKDTVYSVFEMSSGKSDAVRLEQGKEINGCLVSYENNEFSASSGEALPYDTQNYIVTLSSGTIQGNQGAQDELLIGKCQYGAHVQAQNFSAVTYKDQNVFGKFSEISSTLWNCWSLSAELESRGKAIDDPGDLEDPNVQIVTLTQPEVQQLETSKENLVIPYHGTAAQLQDGSGPLLVVNIDLDDATSFDKLSVENNICLTPSDDAHIFYPVANVDGEYQAMASKILWNVYSGEGYFVSFSLNHTLLGTVLCPWGTVNKGAGNLVGAVIAWNVNHKDGEIHKLPIGSHGETTVKCVNSMLGLPTGLAWDLTPFCLLAGASAFGFAAAVRRRRRAVRRGC